MLALARMRFSRFVCTTLLFTVPASTQELPLPGGAPAPSALLTAKKIFISNAGADSGLFPHPFSGNPGRAYNQFYAAVQNWGRYECVTDPSDADLVFELRQTAPYGPTNANKQKGAPDPLPTLRLVILDRKTHYVLWALTESMEQANLQKTRDRNFDQALTALTLDWKKLTTSSTAATR